MAILLIYAAIIGALAAVAMLVSPAVGAQISEVAARGPAMVEPAQRFPHGPAIRDIMNSTVLRFDADSPHRADG